MNFNHLKINIFFIFIFVIFFKTLKTDDKSYPVCFKNDNVFRSAFQYSNVFFENLSTYIILTL